MPTFQLADSTHRVPESKILKAFFFSSSSFNIHKINQNMSRRANTGHRQHQLAAQQQPPPPRQRQRRHNNINNAVEREREREVARAESPDSSEMASCVSSVGNVQEEATSRYAGGDSPEETSSAAGADEGQMMMVMGCHRCMMYVMMTEDGQPRCPKCGSTVLLDLQEKTQGKRRVY